MIEKLRSALTIKKLKAEVEKLKAENLAYKKLTKDMVGVIMLEIPEEKKNEKVIAVIEAWSELFLSTYNLED